MPRPPNSPNRYYHFEVILDEEKTLLRTMDCLADFLELGKATVQRKLKKPSIILNKYKKHTLVINRVKIPMYQRADVPIQY